MKIRTRHIGVIGTFLALLGLAIVNGGSSGAAEAPPLPQVVQDAMAPAPTSTDTVAVTADQPPVVDLVDAPVPVPEPTYENPYPPYIPFGDPSVQIIDAPSCSGGTMVGWSVSITCQGGKDVLAGYSIQLGGVDPYSGYYIAPNCSGWVSNKDSSVSGTIGYTDDGDQFARVNYMDVNNVLWRSADFYGYQFIGNLPVSDYFEYTDEDGNLHFELYVSIPDGTFMTAHIIDADTTITGSVVLTDAQGTPVCSIDEMIGYEMPPVLGSLNMPFDHDAAAAHPYLPLVGMK